MKRYLIFGLALTTAMALSWTAGGDRAQASNQIAQKEGLPCTTCHDKPGSKLFTDQGKYYEEMHTLKGYDDVVVAFSKCTSCHEKKPGAKRLTERGERYKWVVNDMEGLRQWLWENHPRGQARAAEVEKNTDKHGRARTNKDESGFSRPCQSVRVRVCPCVRVWR